MTQQLGIGNVEQLLGNHTRSVAQGTWVVGSGSTDSVINAVLANPAGSAVNLSANIVTALTHNTVEFTGGANLGAMRQIASITTAGVLTLDAALPAAPATGDPFTILNAVEVSVTASENVADVGGSAVPTDFAGNPAVPTTQFDQLVQDGTIGSNQIGFVSSGNEVAYDTLTVNGTWRVNGSAYLGGLVVNLGGAVIIGDTGQITTGSY